MIESIEVISQHYHNFKIKEPKLKKKQLSATFDSHADSFSFDN